MLLKFYRLRDVNIPKLFWVYQRQLNAEWESRWDLENTFCEDLGLFFSCNGTFLAVVDIDGVYVSAARIEPYCDGYLITCLETAPPHRRKGYASMLLDEVMEVHPGVYYAHVDKRNKASLALHKKLGFQVYLDHAVYVDGSVYTGSFTLKR